MRGRALTIFLGGALLVTSACSATVRSATDNVGATETSAVDESFDPTLLADVAVAIVLT